MASTVQAWHRDVRDGDGPVLAIHPAGTPDPLLFNGDVVDRPFSRMVFRWPGRDVLLQDGVEHSKTPVAAVEST
ncbi:hypothetical protein [Streptomyces sp. NPDC088137]|uniref:hypothetical protein n=1 Tax=Streptomyces sp. NPDC088137 TaxID=3365827 RepID=UPI00380BCD42